MKPYLRLTFLLLIFSTLACNLFSFGSTGPGRNAAIVTIHANSGVFPWLIEAAETFNSSGTETANGRSVYVEVTPFDAGLAITEIQSGNVPVMWLPDEIVWANVLADQGNSSFQGDCSSAANSPLVIGMWREAAESLGWPGLPLGWLDIGSLAADDSAWQYYSGGQFGSTLRMGHTHPGLSGSGASTLLAVVQAAQSKTDAVTVTDIQQPVVQASVGAFESGVAIFSTDSASLGQQMQARGVQYLGAAIMPESTVLQYGRSEIIPVYPLEGTFMATHPACINQTSSSEQQEAAAIFRDFLLSLEGQSLATSHGLRPVIENAEINPPLTPAFGVDLSQPEIVFGPPSVEAIYAIQDVWQSARKDVNLVMLLDVSGSMRGSKMENMRQAAEQFVNQMGDDDRITLIAFSSSPRILVEQAVIGETRTKIINAIRGLEAVGDTSLYDAIGTGAEIIVNNKNVNMTDALVVLTDGEDTYSFSYSASTAAQAALNSGATVFTIAYGNNADTDTLVFLANEANGNFYEGDEASIAAIYEEMSAAFGGSVGFGR